MSEPIKASRQALVEAIFRAFSREISKRKGEQDDG